MIDITKIKPGQRVLLVEAVVHPTSPISGLNESLGYLWCKDAMGENFRVKPENVREVLPDPIKVGDKVSVINYGVVFTVQGIHDGEAWIVGYSAGKKYSFARGLTVLTKIE